VGSFGQRLVLVEGEEPVGRALRRAHIGDEGMEAVAVFGVGEGVDIAPPAQGEVAVVVTVQFGA
jgi:hypothetical protein